MWPQYGVEQTAEPSKKQRVSSFATLQWQEQKQVEDTIEQSQWRDKKDLRGLEELAVEPNARVVRGKKQCIEVQSSIEPSTASSHTETAPDVLWVLLIL